MALSYASTSTVGGSQGPPTPTTNPVVNIYMMNVNAHLSTRTREYKTSESVEKVKDATNPLTPLQIEKVMGETMTPIPKGVFKKASHNPNVRATQNYSVVEDLAQNPSTMSTMEVLQIFPSQRKYFFSASGAAETCNPRAIIFDPTDLNSHLPHHVSFQIVVAYTYKIFYTEHFPYSG
jgi:hypothetical protein